MTTTTPITYSSSRIIADLQLFAEIQTCGQRQFNETWGGHINDMVVERLWEYGHSVFGTELGLEMVEIDGYKQMISLALEAFGLEAGGDNGPQIWWNGAWRDMIVCESCGKFGVSLADGGDMQLTPCNEQHLCEDCWDEKYLKTDSETDDGMARCFFCENEFNADDLISKVGGNVCVDCENQDFVEKAECYTCDKVFKLSELTGCRAGGLCKQCDDDYTYENTEFDEDTPTTDCSICYGEYPTEIIFKLDDIGKEVCRICLRKYHTDRDDTGRLI